MAVLVGFPKEPPPPADKAPPLSFPWRIGNEFFFVPVPVTVPSLHSGFRHGRPCVLLLRSVSCRVCNRMVVLASCCALCRGVSHSIIT